MAQNLNLLNNIEMKLVAAVLEECVDKFAIMGAKLPDVDASFSMMGINERAMKPIRRTKEKTIVPDEEKDKLILHKLKLSKELKQLEKVLTILKNELKLEGSHISLKLYNYAVAVLQKEEEDLMKTYKEKCSSEASIQVSTKLVIDTIQNELNDLEQEKHSLTMQLQELEYKSNSIKLYSKNYYEKGVEQNHLKILLTEEQLQKKLDDTIKTTKDEKKVHEQIDKYLNSEIKKLQNSLEFWNKTYINDIENKHAMLMKLETEITDQRYQTSELFAEFCKRETEIKEYLIVRAERIRLEELEKLRNRAATKIQAWWRGCMVRWELGEYSQDLGKRKKRKSKKKPNV